MQIRIISLHSPDALVARMQSLFPHADVRKAPGVDVRSTPVDDLERAGVVTHGAAHALRHGRKWHHELTMGAVGLALAVRNALDEDPSQPLLLLEDDCVVTDAFRDDVRHALAHTDAFDVANLSMLLQPGGRASQSALGPNWWHVQGPFWQMHAALYSPRGRSVVACALRRPLEMQLDHYLGALAHVGEVRLVGKLREKNARQAKHVSSVQELAGTCGLCDLDPRLPRWQAVAVVALVALMVAVYARGRTLTFRAS
jgi:hypothetical protein